MAANLTPQYLEAEAEYKRAKTAEERLECLQKMWALLPKHKASEKLQAELKTKMSEARKEVDQEHKHPKKVGVKLTRVMDKAALARIACAGMIRIRVIQTLQIPTTIRRKLADRIRARGEELPELLGR